MQASVGGMQQQVPTPPYQYLPRGPIFSQKVIMTLGLVGIILILVGVILMNCTVWLTGDGAKNALGAGAIVFNIGITFLGMPLLFGGLTNDALERGIRIAMIVMGTIIIVFGCMKGLELMLGGAFARMFAGIP